MMRWYDFMTILWAALTGAACGFVAYSLAEGHPVEAWLLGSFSTVAGAVLTAYWRKVKDLS